MSDSTLLNLRFDTFDLDEKNARLSQNGQPISLPPKAFAVLCALARQGGQLLTKTELLDLVWGHQHVSESVLKTIISELRAALCDDAKQPRYIETASRRGYRFIAAIHTQQKPDPPLAATSLRAQSEYSNAERVEAPPIIGRHATLAKLRTAWDNAVTGRRQIFWVAGEAGVGKTTLIDHFVAELGPVPCGYGQCVEQHGAGEPYLPVLEALGALCRNDAALAPMLRAVAPIWLLQFPWLTNSADREVLRRELAGVGHERMLRELGELLERYTQRQPLLLVTEDLHWSDQATIQLIDHIARRRGAARLMWLCSFRLAEVIAEEHPLKALRHELRLHHLCHEAVLEPFSEQEVADYIDGRFPDREVSEAFVRALHARTDGLPLFVVNVIDDLAMQGVLQSDASGTAADELLAPLQVPENLAGVIEKQIARLSPEQHVLLETASVCGVEFRPGIVARVLARNPGWVQELCAELTRKQQWLSSVTVDRMADGTLDARYAFRHAMYRQVFYQRIAALTRAHLHRRVAVSLVESRATDMTVSAAELAAHYALSHEPVTALQYYIEAAENALRRFAPKEAMSLCVHALGLLPRCQADPMHDALELALSALHGVSAAQLLGVSSLETKRSFERAEALLKTLPHHPLRGLVLQGLGLVLLVRGEYAESQALGERIYELSKTLGDRILVLSACSVLGQVSALQGRPHQAREWLVCGIAICNELGDDALQAAFVVDPGVTMYAALAIPLLHLGLADQARTSFETAEARAQRLGQPMAQMVAAWFGALFEVRLGNANRVAELADGMRTTVETATLAQGEAAHRWFRGWAEAHLGLPREGFQLIREAYDHNARLGMFSGGSEVLGYAAEALVIAGDWVAAQAQLDEAMQLASSLDERVYLPQLYLLQARIALNRRESAAARASMLAALEEANAQRAVWLEITVLVALCELNNSSPDDLAELRDAYAGHTEGFDTAPVIRARELLEITTRSNG